ncbi:MAG: sulfatase-like hydrolase/transferase [Magnetococcales bacterium]|nr:sulfatase-like hydrolase/transferase [Magnetococcales bacterium]
MKPIPSHSWLLRHGSAVGGSLLVSLLGLFPIFIKSLWLGTVNGYCVLTRFLALEQDHLFTELERLSLYREDLLIGGVLLPLLMLFGLMWLRSEAKRIRILLITGILLIAWYYVGLISLGNARKFLSFDLLWEAMTWGIQNPEFIPQYVSPGSLQKLGILIGTILATGGLLVWFTRRAAPLQILWYRRLWWVWLVIIATYLVLIVAGYRFSFPLRAQYRSIPENMIRALITSDLSAGTYRHLDPSRLDQTYRNLTHAPGFNDQSAWFGTEKNSDILLFILETGPERCVELAQNIQDFPALRRLAKRSLFGTRHYTTYPYTSAAMFSIFGSLYPNGRKTLLQQTRQASPVGWVHPLKQAGYRFALYKPSREGFENDFDMFQAFGADPQYFASEHPETLNDPQVTTQLERSLNAMTSDESARQRLHTQVTRDLAAWQTLQRDTRLAQQQGQRFVHAFMPQLGHGPWKEVRPPNQPICERGRDLATLQLSWLNEWIDELANTGRLEQTIVVVTADHGIRLTTEDPALKTGRIDDYTFHVPLMIFAPQTFTQRIELTQPTSHIDIGPSLQHLLGLSAQPAQTHGSLLWDPKLNDRTLFFFGRDYIGVDGFHTGQTFVSCEYFNELCTTSPVMTIPDDRLYLKEGWSDAQALELLRNIYQMENRFMQQVTGHP